MGRTLRAEFNIFISDEFEEAVREYYNYEVTEDIENEDIVEFIGNNIEPAKSMHESFEVEGGDTDGWFISCVRRD